jgi:hypothetical protein
MSTFRKRRPQSKKSCTECIKAKRRCERDTGACVRCIKQKLDCYYFPPSALDLRGLSVGREISTTTNAEENQESTMIQDSTFDFLDFTPNGNLQSGAIGLSTGMDNLFDLNAENTEFAQRPFPVIVGPLVPAINNSISTFDSRSSSIASRVELGIKELKLGPAKMVNESQTAWSHALLYEETMPKSMQGVANSPFLHFKDAKIF